MLFFFVKHINVNIKNSYIFLYIFNAFEHIILSFFNENQIKCFLVCYNKQTIYNPINQRLFGLTFLRKDPNIII